ncbi:MAG: PAS domain S-box protein [Candidatus Schekmanbacteria bacterium]|nr:PAS domain S-box protein [Candidatus Schekmanbacteria bacterium]
MQLVQTIRRRLAAMGHVEKFSATALVVTLALAAVFATVTESVVYRMAEQAETERTAAIIRHRYEHTLRPEIFALGDPVSSESLRASLNRAFILDDIFRVKIYAASGMVTWSDEARLIGKDLSTNELFQVAVQGHPVSKIEAPHRHEHEFEKGTHEKVMETYVPIFARGKLLGVIETYRYPEDFFRRSATAGWIIWAGILVAGAILYGIMVGVVRRINTYQRGLEKALRYSRDSLAREKTRLENIVNAIGAGLVLVDQRGNILWSNDIATRWFGLAEDREGTCYGRLWGASAPCPSCIRACGDAQDKLRYCEHRVVDENGRERHYEVITTTNPALDPAEPMRFLELVLDVTEAKQAQKRLQLADKSALIAQLLGGLTEQINTPVSILLTTVTRHLGEPLRSRYEKDLLHDLELMERQCQRIDFALRSLLSFSQSAAEARVAVSLSEVVSKAATLLSPRIARNAVELQTSASAPAALAEGAPNDLLQVVLNLLDNALDVTPSGGKIEVGLVIEPKHNGAPEEIVLTVSDTGPGLEPEVLPKLFQPFFTTKGDRAGSGLGLAVSQRIIESMGGSIRAFNKDTLGACFEVRLPVFRDAPTN